jgi:hypothetical protein
MTMTTTTYRQAELEAAREELAAARTRLEKWLPRKWKLEAREDVEFWGNKVAFFTNLYHGAFPDEV